MSSFDSSFTPVGRNEAIAGRFDAEESLENISDCSFTVWNMVDVAILRAMGQDLRDVVVGPLMDEATAAAYPALAKILYRQWRTEEWPLDEDGAEGILLNQALAKEPGLEARDPSLENVYLDVEDIAITLAEPLLEDFPETSVVTGLSIDRRLHSSEVSVYFETQGGFKIAYLFEDKTGLPHTALGGMKRPEALCQQTHLEYERQITPPGSPDEQTIYDKLAEGGEVAVEESKIILDSFKAYCEASKLGLLVPPPEEVLRVAGAIHQIGLEGKLAGNTKLTLQLWLNDGLNTGRHDVEL